jgi:NAD+ kinase
MARTRIGLVARDSLPSALDAVREAVAWLDSRGYAALIERQTAVAAGLTAGRPALDRADFARQAEVIVAFGGDGTLLDAAGMVAESNSAAPVLGVNLGRLGFLTEVSRGELAATLEAVVKEETRTEPRLLLAGRVERRGQPLIERLALNDIVIQGTVSTRMIGVDVSVNGRSVCHVKADGVIVATATGSTAYNLSVGGPIVHPEVDAILLTPIAPHTLTQRPLVLPATVDLTLRLLPDGQAAEGLATFDGQEAVRVGHGEVVAIKRATKVIHLLRVSARTHFDMLREKLKWG